MPYYLVSDFRSGLDVRRSPWTSEAGTLQVCQNGHITRGGEVEKRKEFTSLGALLASTYALAAGRDASDNPRGLMVFGSDPAPVGLPAGVTYQRLQHPDGAADMVEVVATTLFDGRPYVVARFDDESYWHFYDGALVTDWGAGVVRAAMATTADIAEHLRQLIDADADYAATRLGNQITIVGPIGVNYDASGETENVSGGLNDQTLTFAIIEDEIAEVAGANASAEFSIISGTDDNGAANYISAIRVDAAGVFTDLISSNVAFDTSPELTGLAVVTAINAGTGVHGYVAATRYGRVFIYATATDGAAANSRVLEVTAKGNIVLYTGGFTITGGTVSAGVNKVTSVKANGLEILSVSVDYTTDNATTAAAVAAQIVAYASTPKWNAHAEGATVFLSPEKIRSDDATSISVTVTSAGDVTFDTSTSPPVPSVVGQYPDYGTQRPGLPPGSSQVEL